MTDFSYVDQNLAEIRARIDAASQRSGGRDVTLLAAVKYTDTDHINYLHSLGVNDIGENRVQQLLEHWEALDRQNLRVHFIGTLQKNKVKFVKPHDARVENPLGSRVRKFKILSIQNKKAVTTKWSKLLFWSE